MSLDSAIVSGLIGGAIGVAITATISKSARGKRTKGQLQYGITMLVLAILCALFSVIAVWAFFNDNDVHEKASELIAVVGLFVGFGFGAFACFAEYFKTKGCFDSERIEFHTPWTGTKIEQWEDLVSANFNSSMYWYVLKFKSGKVIRLSTYLHGHGEVLNILRDRGIEL